MQAALDEVMKGRTTFVIAHRLATMRNATRILVFEHGRIIESGTFDELVRARRRISPSSPRRQFLTDGGGPPRSTTVDRRRATPSAGRRRGDYLIRSRMLT